MYTIRKTFKFEMSHQLVDSYSVACQNLHGHSYTCEIFLKSEGVDDTGMVCDFKKIKDQISEYINEWDHCIVLPDSLPAEYIDCIKKYNKRVKILDYNPTAELMCKDMFNYIKRVVPLLSKVRLHETTTGWAEYEETGCRCK